MGVLRAAEPGLRRQPTAPTGLGQRSSTPLSHAVGDRWPGTYILQNVINDVESELAEEVCIICSFI